MRVPKLFIHGVPDSPLVWDPLKTALTATGGSVPDTPALPGFTSAPPAGFTATKETYTGWLIARLEGIAEKSGPVDLVGHDWGALLALRAACLRPELIRSWAVSGAVIAADYKGHTTARRWANPLIGELVMALTSPPLLQKTLMQGGLPTAIAKQDAASWTKTKRQCILQLYRSARGLRFEGDWIKDLAELPARGLVIWGENDPYVDAGFGKRFAERQSVPFHVLPDTGHWAIAEKPEQIASLLQTLWADP